VAVVVVVAAESMERGGEMLDMLSCHGACDDNSSTVHYSTDGEAVRSMTVHAMTQPTD
jgi:hypothetical protein